MPTPDKSAALLQFLRETALLRRKRVAAYGANDRILWFSEVPRDQPECQSPFQAPEAAEVAEWLVVRKKRPPVRPPVPEIAIDWVRTEELEQADKEPELLPEITLFVDRPIPDTEAPPEHPRTRLERVPELRRLCDHPEVEDTWLEYLVNKWEPWSKETKRWQSIHRVYEDVDFMRRRLEEAEERFELVVAVGLLQWRDATSTPIKRHFLTAPAEISLDAARGVLSVVPSASFDAFRIELDMLDYADQPRLQGSDLADRLEDLDIQAWDQKKVGEILQIIANQANSNASVDEHTLTPLDRTDENFRVVFAPALVLRERRPTAYEELIKGLHVAITGESAGSITGPWKRFIAEGESSGSHGNNSTSESEPTSSARDDGQGRLLFPLPTNAEQRNIVNCLRRNPYVMVKGPPGTGKSLTIANLICHLLASGDRILVTAHAAKALVVLRELLPQSVRDLCVTALGSTRDDQRILEEGVRQILRQQNEMDSAEWSEQRLTSLESELQQLEEKLSAVERRIRECREAEVHSHNLAGGYRGTAASIAKQLAEEANGFDWLDARPDISKPFPLEVEEVRILSEIHGRLTADWLQQVNQDCCTLELPNSDAFIAITKKCTAAEEAATAAQKQARPEYLAALRSADPVNLTASKKTLRVLTEESARAQRALGSITDEILHDVLVHNESRWQRLTRDIDRILKAAAPHSSMLGSSRVELPADMEHAALLADVDRRLAHFRGGGRRWFCRLVKETRYVEETCRVDGSPSRTVDALDKLRAFLQLTSCLKEFERVWPSRVDLNVGDPIRCLAVISDHAKALRRLVALSEEFGSDSLLCIPVEYRDSLARREERITWLDAVNGTLASHDARAAREPLEQLFNELKQAAAKERVHTCVRELESACRKRDPGEWRQATEVRGRLLKQKAYLQKYETIVKRLEIACPGIQDLLRKSQGDPTWNSRLQQFEKAWCWAGAKDWVRRVSDPSAHCDYIRTSHRLQDAIEKKIEQIATVRAWRAFFKRLDDLTVQALKAWAKAVDRIGKGTGKHAYRHRRTARQYLMDCIPKIPAWIMPLHRLWETVDAEPGLFDTIIIDEASQAGIDSLALLLLAKRIIVVGDDKQNSPEAVGVLEDDISRLARSHLAQFRFRNEFRPDTSLFDHAERAFGNMVSLREHFRCVPEIIRFSNDLCYNDSPLIPLRQAPPNHLVPLKAICTPGGSCEGEGQKVFNRAEAQAIVDTIRKCITDDAYDGKTMGIIVLQGHAQAELIGRMLAQEMDPKVIEERKLRCGVPATFQGDQRDIMFLSLVIAPNVNHRALNRLPDQRRFNVAMSRARDQVWLFHSVQQHDLSPECLRRRLLAFFQTPTGDVGNQRTIQWEQLEIEARRSPRRIGEQPEPYESWFEVDICIELLRKGYTVRPQYEVAGKYIDLVVEGVDARLAVECDGDVWHGAEQYDRDMARQRQLERAGWTIVRVRESEFYADRTQAISQVIEECERLGVYPPGYVKPITISRINVDVGEEDQLTHSGQQGNLGDNESDKQDDAEDPSDATTGPFTGYSGGCGFPDPREASSANIRAALLDVIKKDGPLTRASAFKLYVEGCPHLQRGGKAVRQILNRALGTMLRAGEIVQEDELGDGATDSLVIRLADTPRVRERPAGRRDILEIPPSELHMLLNRIDPLSAQSADSESVFRSVLDHFGYTRLTAIRRKYLNQVMRRRRSGFLASDPPQAVAPSE